MFTALREHWPEYLMEAAELGLFMISACTFAALLRHPASSLSAVLPHPTGERLLMGIAMGLHVRVGQEDNLYGRRGERATSVQQIEKMAKISQELWRPVATPEQARAIYKIGTFYSSIEETLEQNGWLPNRKPVLARELEAA